MTPPASTEGTCKKGFERVAETFAQNFAERGEVGAGGPTRSRPPVIDRANNRLTFNFMLPIRLDRYSSKYPANAELRRRHGYRPALDRLCCHIVAWIQQARPGVRVKSA